MANLTSTRISRGVRGRDVGRYSALLSRTWPRGRSINRASRGGCAIGRRLEELVSEAGAIAYIAYTTDTASEAKEAAQLRFSSEIEPQMHEQHVGLSKRLLDLGYEPADTETLLRSFRNQLAIFREENVPLVGDEERLNTQYNKITGGMTVQWEGEEIPLPRLAPLSCSARIATCASGHGGSAPSRISTSTTPLPTFSTSNTRSGSRWRRTPGSPTTGTTCTRRRIASTTRRRISSASTPPSSRPSCPPWRGGWSGGGADGPRHLPPVGHRGRPRRAARRSSRSRTSSTLIGQAETIFERVDPTLGGYFTTMANEHLLDLDSRKGKAPGGYCIDYAVPQAAVHLHECGRRRGRCRYAAARGGARLPCLRDAATSPSTGSATPARRWRRSPR